MSMIVYSYWKINKRIVFTFCERRLHSRNTKTMLLYSLQILYKGEDQSNQLQGAYDLSSFGFFQRGSVQEFLNFTAKLICERTAVSTRAAVQEKEYFCHIYVRYDKLCAVLFSDFDYPQRVAQTLLTKVLEDFTNEYNPSIWPTMTPGSGSLKKVDAYLSQYQDPQQADSLTRLQADVQETTEILHQTMESLFQRGEKLDDLVSKSDQLGVQSKLFYQTAKKTNRCCTLL